MNILVSYNWLKEYLKTDLSPEEFAARVSLCGPSVERIHRQEQTFAHMVVGKILGIEKHPNADKLRLVEVDIGRKLKVVCGGSNLRGGMKVAVALEGAKVKWHGGGELVELKPTEIRGVKSEGMICASSEIGLEHAYLAKAEPRSELRSTTGDDHEIVDLSDLPAKSGTPLGEALGGKDVVFDIEVTTNRPDAMCVLGIAREAGTILKAPFNPPKIQSIKKSAGKFSLAVRNDEPELCPRYQAVAIQGVKVAPSPWWLKQKLISLGSRPINNVVDITNLVLWEMGQPLHAFDYEKLSGPTSPRLRGAGKKIAVRKAKKGEKIKALDGNEYKLQESHLVIADGKRPVAVAGVMGGEETGVTEATKTIVLEAANFNPVSVRHTARELNLRSDSSNLFEKGLSTEGTAPALARTVGLILEICGGTVASEVFDLRNKKYKPATVAMSVEKTNKIMGVELEAEAMKEILSRLGFDATLHGGEIKARVPFWRDGDIEIEEDLIEEVARIYGYHRLPSILPAGAPPADGPDKIFHWENTARELATAAGFDEILSYTMISKKMMESTGETGAVKIANPLSAELEYMRTCLFPGLLQTISENEKNFSSGKIFELGRVYTPTKKGELPDEELHFSGMMWGAGNLFSAAKGFAEKFLEKFGLSGCVFKDADDKNMHPARSTDIYCGKDYVGSFGEVHPATAKNFNIDPVRSRTQTQASATSNGVDSRASLETSKISSLTGRVGFFYFYLGDAVKHAKAHKSYMPIPDYPGVKRDISFVVDARAEYEKIREALASADPLVADIDIFDVYEGKGVPAGKKSMALHILFRSSNRTLETKEADGAFDKIAAVLQKKFDAEIRK